MTTFTANHVPGAGRGKEMGFPTVNLDTNSVPADLTAGIYACRVWLDAAETALDAVMHYGQRPTFDAGVACEVHIIDHVLEQTPSRVTVELVQQLREPMHFPSAEALVTQLQADIAQARGILTANAEST